jgi:tRNA pseudouridine38-40 synthase
VGTVVAVGLGLAPASRVAELIRARERYRGVRAPAWGLTLEKVSYPPGTLPLQGEAESPPTDDSPYLVSRSETASRR